MRTIRLQAIGVSLLLGLWLLAGCQPRPTKQGLLEAASADVHISSHQLRVMVNEYAKHFAERVELNADEILAETSDPEIRRNALLWKINAISACFQAAARQDPLAAYLDLWILNRQMTQLFETSTNDAQFGAWQSVARRECQAFEHRLQRIFEEAGTELPYRAALVETFASEHPLTSMYFDREPIATQFIQEVREPNRELFHVVADMEQNLIEMQKLAVWYAEYLPKQARWEAELLLTNATQLAVVQQPLADFRLAAGSISRIAQTTESLPDLVSAERQAFHQIITQERAATLHELERVTDKTLSVLQQERAEVLRSLQTERVAISKDLESHVTRTLQTTDLLTQQRVDEVVQQIPVAIDHFFWRTWQLLGIGLLMAIGGGATTFWWRRQLRRREGGHLPDIAPFDARSDAPRRAA